MTNINISLPEFDTMAPEEKEEVLREVEHFKTILAEEVEQGLLNEKVMVANVLKRMEGSKLQIPKVGVEKIIRQLVNDKKNFW